jgi:putative component of membrane protein insertase Oxa1/YidC/SpoIIIJ protein YidD
MIKYILIFVLFIPFCSPCQAMEQPRFDPWDFNGPAVNTPPPAMKKSSLSPPAELLRRGIEAFRETVSAVDGDRCPMTPTCSAYSLQAIEMHGFIMGVFMTADRLIHEMDETALAPVVTVQGEPRFFDPVGANDLWWRSPGKLDK